MYIRFIFSAGLPELHTAPFFLGERVWKITIRQLAESRLKKFVHTGTTCMLKDTGESRLMNDTKCWCFYPDGQWPSGGAATTAVLTITRERTLTCFACRQHLQRRICTHLETNELLIRMSRCTWTGEIYVNKTFFLLVWLIEEALPESDTLAVSKMSVENA